MNFTNRWPWAKKLGIIGFLFFLIKGVLWLIVPMVTVWVCN